MAIKWKVLSSPFLRVAKHLASFLKLGLCSLHYMCIQFLNQYLILPPEVSLSGHSVVDVIWCGSGKQDYYKLKHIMESPRELEENLERLAAKGQSSNIDSAILWYLGSYLASLSLGILA